VANENALSREASPASVARTQADHGAQLAHPDVLNADVRWRSPRLFTAEELKFDTVAAAVAWMEELPRKNPPREPVLSLKRELELVVASSRTNEKDRHLAAEVAQWLTIWLQSPQIFADWFALRRETAEFRRLFES
jgi:hypothetical protein